MTNKHARIVLILTIFVMIIAMNCGGEKPPVNITPPASSEIVKDVPDWFLNVPQDPNYLFAASSATSRDMQLAVNKAKQNGRNEIATQLEQHVSGMTKQFTEEVGMNEDSEILSQFTQTVEAIVDQTLNGSRAEKQEIRKDPSDIYRAYVLVSMPIGEANVALMDKIKKDNRFYTEFKSTEAFKELEQKIDNYRQYKAEQEAKMKEKLEGTKE